MSESDVPQQGRAIVFGQTELEPDDMRRYQEKIDRAKSGIPLSSLKGNTPVGHVPRPANAPLLVNQKSRPESSPLTDDGGVQPRPPGSPLLRPETAQQLQDMAAAQVKQQQTEAKAEPKRDLDVEKEDLFEMFDFGGKNEQDRILNNKKRRKEIESRCEPMKLEDLILRDEVQQVVPIVPDKFVVKYRSATPQEDLFIKRVMSGEKVESDQYLLEKYAICQLACSLVSINGSVLPSHLNEHGMPDDGLFQAKLKMILKKSLYIISDLCTNYYWFDLRVRRLLNPEDLKNG